MDLIMMFFLSPLTATLYIQQELDSLDDQCASLNGSSNQDLLELFDTVKNSLTNDWRFNWLQPVAVQRKFLDSLSEYLNFLQDFAQLRSADNKNIDSISSKEISMRLKTFKDNADRCLSELSWLQSEMDFQQILILEKNQVFRRDPLAYSTPLLKVGEVVTTTLSIGISAFASSVFSGSWLPNLIGLSVYLVSMPVLQHLESKINFRKHISYDLLQSINFCLSITASLFVLSTLKGSLLVALAQSLIPFIVFLAGSIVIAAGLRLAHDKMASSFLSQQTNSLTAAVQTFKEKIDAYSKNSNDFTENFRTNIDGESNKL